jgi:hypothetical protein
VPHDYIHDTQIDIFVKKIEKEKTAYYYDSDFTSENFINASTKLTPGKMYKVKIFPILANVRSEDCITFLHKQKAVFVGAQGLTLVCEQANEKLPKDTYIVSFDEKNALWQSFKDYRVPRVRVGSSGVFGVRLGFFSRELNSMSALMCFCDV